MRFESGVLSDKRVPVLLFERFELFRSYEFNILCLRLGMEYDFERLALRIGYCRSERQSYGVVSYRVRNGV